MFQAICKECNNIFKSTKSGNIEDSKSKIVKVSYTKHLMEINCDCGNKIHTIKEDKIDFKFEIGEKVYVKDFFSCYDNKIGTITMQVNDEKVNGKKVNAYTVKFENDIVWLFDERDIRRVDE